MAVVLGVSAGFVTTAPTADPLGTNIIGVIDGDADVVKDTSPSTASTITEVGFWCDDDHDSGGTFEVGLYAADGSGGIAGTRLYLSTGHDLGTTAGWLKVTGLDWAISASTSYWIGISSSALGSGFTGDQTSSGGLGYDQRTGSTLQDPFGGGTVVDSDGTMAIYAVWEATPLEGGTSQTLINISDEMRNAGAILINISDEMRNASEIYINLSDTLRRVFRT